VFVNGDFICTERHDMIAHTRGALADWSPLTEADARARMDRVVTEVVGSPFTFSGHGRGVVIPGGGAKYFPSAWVCIRMLRWLGCRLPVELWHLGPMEMTREMRDAIEPHDVTCVDALDVCRQSPVRTLGGWELKPFALLHSRFAEVLFLDADNVPVRDPTYLFDTDEYCRHGAVFWPDPYCLCENDPVWGLTGASYHHEPAFESGQMLIDRRRSLGALRLALWMNEHSDFWYRFIYGDKDTFHLAWRRLEQAYVVQRIPFESLGGVICQFDFLARRLFQHRHGDKWRLDGSNRRIRNFRFEELCFSFVTELNAILATPAQTH